MSGEYETYAPHDFCFPVKVPELTPTSQVEAHPSYVLQDGKRVVYIALLTNAIQQPAVKEMLDMPTWTYP